MKKFWMIAVIGLGFLAFYLGVDASNPLLSGECAFCKENVLQRQTFYEDESVLALYTHKPILPGHVLIIPKRHVERFEDLTVDEVRQMFETVKKVNIAISKVFGTSSYLLLQKNGFEVGQTVPHVHIHYIAKKANDTSNLKFLVKMYLNRFFSPISDQEMKNITDKLKTNMNEMDNN